MINVKSTYINESPHLTIAYRLSGKSRLQGQEGCPPSINLEVCDIGSYPFTWVECERPMLVTLVRIENDQFGSQELMKVATNGVIAKFQYNY